MTPEEIEKMEDSFNFYSSKIDRMINHNEIISFGAGFTSGLAAQKKPKWNTFEEWQNSFTDKPKWNYDEEQMMIKAWEAARQ